jgi:hypothetical protein
MAISDVLFEATLEIKEYRNNGIGMYSDPQLRAEIDKLGSAQNPAGRDAIVRRGPLYHTRGHSGPFLARL